MISGEVDLLARNTTWTFSRDTDLKVEFVGINFYDGQGFMVRRFLGITSASELEGARICTHTGTTTDFNTADFFHSNQIDYVPVQIEFSSGPRSQYLIGDCDVIADDNLSLALTRATLDKPRDHILLPEIISKEPLGSLVRHGDDEWADVVRWTLNALIAAEELGITSENLTELSAAPTDNPEINRMLGTEGELGSMLGLDRTWAQAAIGAGGNYGELFARHLGETTPLGLARSLNAQWTDGGLIYSPPFR